MRLLMLATLAATQVVGAPVKHLSTNRPVVAQKAQASLAKTPPVFSFLGQTTETATQRTSLNDSNCTDKGPIRDCADLADPSIGGQQLKFMYLKYYNGMLYQVYGNFGEYAWSGLLSAFTEKYGPPNAIEKRKWQSKGGATFDNAVAIWQFKGGKLELEQLDLDTSSGGFTLTSTKNSPPSEKPKVDF